MRTVKKTSVFPASKERVFARLLKLKTLQYIAYPYATFTPLDGTDGMSWEVGSTSRFKFRLFGIIPFGTHTIRVIRFGMDEGIYTHEGNEHVPVWDHEIILEELPGDKCRYTDKVDIDAGWKTIFIWMWANCFYAHRQRKWIKLLRGSVWTQMESFLGSRYEPSEVRRYIRSAQDQYEKWISSIEEPSPSRRKTMKNTILPRVALYAALKEDGQNADAVLDAYVRDVAGPMMHQMYARMEKIPGFWVIFKNLLKIITDKSDNWKCESRKEKDKLYLNIHKCLWHDTCTRVGYPECCRFFCECDNYTYGGLKKMGFQRTQTLGAGGELCDFVMYRKKGGDTMQTEKSELKKKTIKTMKDKKAFRVELATRLSSAECDKIWHDAHKRLYRMYTEHQDLPKGVATHTDGFIFPAAAIYLAMKEVDPDMAYDIMKKIMAEKSTKTGQSIAKLCRIPGFSKFFLGTWDSVSHKMFGEASGFKNVFYPKEKGCFRMDIIQCPYNKYLTEQGCPELNILFCENDVHAYGNLPGLRFTRTKTIGAGNELCDFKMELE